MSEECAKQAVLYAMEDGVTVPSVDAPLPGGEPLGGNELQLILVDAIFGIGLDRPVEGEYLEMITQINRLRATHSTACRVMALDLPSGVSADSGKVLGAAVGADITVTFGQYKRGILLHPARLWVGELTVADIGIGTKGALGEYPAEWLCEEEDVHKTLRRYPYSNKGTYGRAVILAGCRGMSGAATLAARAAYRTGVGLCEVVTDESNRIILQTTVPEAIVSTYEKEDDLSAVDTALTRADSIVIGCGLGQSELSLAILRRVLTYCKETRSVPLVIDADGLNLISAHPELWEIVPRDAILTPHPGEMARLCRCTVAEIVGDLHGYARRLAAEHDVVCVLKDACTVVATKGRVFYPLCGNNGMATGGSGDVLAGILGAVLAARREEFGMDPGYFAAIGSSIHAMAGNHAVRKTGEHGLMASDIADAVGSVLG
jgi:NAD(P)H-hydrate epimerase